MSSLKNHFISKTLCPKNNHWKGIGTSNKPKINWKCYKSCTKHPQGWWRVLHVASMLPFTRLPGRNQLLWQAYVWQDGAVPFCAQRRRPGDLTLPRQMASLMSLEEHHVPPPSGTAPAGIRLTSFSKVTFQSSSFPFFFFLPFACS